MKKTILFLFILAFRFGGNAQPATWETSNRQEFISAYQKACHWFIATPSYCFKLKYASFKDYVAKEPIEISTGYCKRLENNCITEVMGVKTVQNVKLRLVIDSADKTITLMDPASLSPAIAGTEEMEKLLARVKGIRKIKLGKSVRYRVDFNKNTQYEAYEFTVNAQDHLENLVYYYSEQVQKDYQEDDYQKAREIKMKPRLEITFFAYQSPVTIRESEFSEKDVLIKEKEKIQLTGLYKTFRLLDYRITAKK